MAFTIRKSRISNVLVSWFLLFLLFYFFWQPEAFYNVDEANTYLSLAPEKISLTFFCSFVPIYSLKRSLPHSNWNRGLHRAQRCHSIPLAAGPTELLINQLIEAPKINPSSFIISLAIFSFRKTPYL